MLANYVIAVLSLFSTILAVAVAGVGTFTNPIIKSGADPWVIHHDGHYYYCYSAGDKLYVSKAKNLQDIGKGEVKLVFTPLKAEYSREVWAPELHHIQGKWYIYFAADDGNNDHHKMYVVESDSPQGNFIFKGKIAAKPDKWAIDGTVLDDGKGHLYFVWSGWEGDTNYRQDIYVAPMSNPWTISGERVRISMPTYDWEKVGTSKYVPGGINEGPEAFVRNGKIFIVYSASASWDDNYCLGMIACRDGNVMNPSSWKKASHPVFSKAREAYGPGHASFTKSPDGTEDWIVYHAIMQSGAGWNGRSVRIQKFKTLADGTPLFGSPVKCLTPIPVPSGST